MSFELVTLVVSKTRYLVMLVLTQPGPAAAILVLQTNRTSPHLLLDFGHNT